MRTLLAASLIAAYLVGGAPGAAATPDTDQRLLSLADLWGDVEYFDPRLARPNDWDAAALAAIPKVEAATSPSTFSDAVASMLASLNDPLTHIVATPQPVAHVSGDGLALASPDTQTAVLTINAAALPDAGSSEVQNRAATLARTLQSMATVVVDLRQNNSESSAQADNVAALFDTTPLAASLTRGNVQLPAYRRRYYNGLTSPYLPSDENYTGGFIIDDGAAVTGTATAHERVAFVVSARTTIPDLAIALVRANQAVVFSDGPPPALDGGDVDALRMPDGLSAQFRVSEYAEVAASASFVQPLPVGENPATAIASWLDHHSPTAPAFQPAPPGVTLAMEAGSPALPDEPHRIFAVFRIYNAIRYFFPYRELMHEDWSAATLRAIREVRTANDEASYIRAIRRYYALIHDGHGFVEGQVVQLLFGAGAPCVSRYLHGEIVVTNLVDAVACIDAGVRVGDVVTAVGGVPARDALAAQRPFVNGSTPQGVVQNLVGDVATSIFAGPAGSSIEITFRHPRSSKTFTARFRRRNVLVREQRSGPIVRVLPGNVGYVDLNRLESSDVDAMFARLAKTRAIVFDDRGYPRGTAWSIAPRLAAGDDVRAALFHQVMALAPYVTEGEAYFGQSFRTFYQILPPADGARYLKPTVTLIDERAISQAEHTGLFFSAAGHTRFVGTPTAGANGDITAFGIPGGLTLIFSGQGVRFADGRQLQRIGIIPDVRSEPSAADIAAGRDVVLETGLREALRLAGAGQAAGVAALKQMRSIELADVAAQARATKETLALERIEQANLGKSLPGATGTTAITIAPLSAAQSTANNVVSNGQRIDASPYRGKAVHIFGMLQTVNAPQGGVFWVRVDGPDGPIALDNMTDRMLHGTSAWQPFSIVLQVPNEATGIFAGLLLFGHGEISVSHLTIEAVPASTPRTGYV
ncbi:MAG: S41 family peptidase [Candidatus Cybelea sp.]